MMARTSQFRGNQRLRSARRRRPRLETLEDRRLLASLPWAEQAKLVAEESTANDSAGYSIAVSGDTMVVGALQPPAGDVAAGEGAAFVYHRDDNGTPFVQTDDIWEQQSTLTASDGASGDQFGYSVAISGDTIVVGSRLDGSGGSGSAYVFVRSGTTWSQQKKLTASDAAAGDWFGRSVAISGETVVVGSPRDDIDTDGDGTADQDSAGSIYVFSRSGVSWSEQQKLTASDAARYDEFGHSVAISDDSVVVGSRGDDLINGDQNAGAAYVFTRSGASWGEQQKLTASDAKEGVNFGDAVAISGDTVVVGSLLDDLDTNGDGTIDVLNGGSAYVFYRNGASWSEQQKLIASDAGRIDLFGNSVSISDDTVVVGSRKHDLPSTNAGSAYMFTRSGASWSEQQKLTASDAGRLEEFGTSVAVSGDTVVVGARLDDDAGFRSGSAYAFVSTIVNEAPSITSAAVVDAAENQTFAIDVESTDPDGETENGGGLMYSLTGGADQGLFSLNVDTGELTFNTAPDFENSGDDGGNNVYDVQVTVTDAGGLSGLRDLAVTVINVNEVPFLANPIADVEATEDAADDVLDLSGSFADIDAGDVLTHSVVGNTNAGLVAATFNGSDLTLDYLDDQNGATEITVRATDSGGLFVEDTFTVVVLSAREQLDNLVVAVENLDLKKGDSKHLTTKLDNAIKKLEQGKNSDAVKQMEGFIKDVAKLADKGKITEAEGDALIDAANAVITSALPGSPAAEDVDAMFSELV